MEDKLLQLSILRAQYYALLASFGGLLVMLGLVVSIKINFSAPTLDPQEQISVVKPTDPQYLAGERLFLPNCGSCHAKDMKTAINAPALAGTLERWSEYPEKDLYDWIRNSQQLVEKDHPRAKQLWLKWKPRIMPPFSTLSDEEIEALLVYIGS